MFVRQFNNRLSKTLERFLSQQTVTPLSSQHETLAEKALMHAFQLYDFPSALKLIANYDPAQELSQVSLPNIRRSLHSLSLIPVLEKLAATHQEADDLLAYKQRLKRHLANTLSGELQHVDQTTSVKQVLKALAQKCSPLESPGNAFFEERLGLLFSPTYQTYLILRNRYFLQYLRQYAQETLFAQWLLLTLNQIKGASLLTLDARLNELNFRTVEMLVQLAMRQFGEIVKRPPGWQLPAFPEASEEDPQSELPPGILRSLRQVESIPTSPPLAVEAPLNNSSLVQEPGVAEDAVSAGAVVSPSLPPAPEMPFIRTPFEKLCFVYVEPLLYLASHTDLVRECSAPYYHLKSEEYLSFERHVFVDFFGGQSATLDSFSEFLSRLLQHLAPENPFIPQMEKMGLYRREEGRWKRVGTQSRQREWTLLFSSELPFSLSLGGEEEVSVIEKGRRFIIQFGLAFFDYDQPAHQRAKTPATGYIKLMIRGSHLSQNSAVIYSGNETFYKLTRSQLIQWRGLVLLYLIVLRNQYSLDLSTHMEDFMVATIPKALKGVENW